MTKIHNYILQNENSIYYECGYSCDNALYLSLGSDNYFITDGRYEIEAKLWAKNCEVIITKDLVKVAKKLIRKTKLKKIVFDPNDFSYMQYKDLNNKLDVKFVKKPNFSKLKRLIKTDQEIELLKKAMVLGRVGFEKFAKYLQKNSNRDEKYLNFIAKKMMTQTGKYELSFDPIVAVNKNSAKPHALPIDTKLKQNDLLLVDAGIKYKRYCSDRTCTSIYDQEINFNRDQKFKSKQQQKIYDIVRLAQETAIKKAKVGMKASKIDKIARDIIHKAGYGKYFTHSTGHGVGLDIHEYPNINSKNDMIIEENMVFTVEPGIYLNNKFGVRIEDTVVMQNGKAQIL
jgi:Xaa-Pro aminopeptidase